MLDKWPTEWRDLFFLLVPAVLGWVGASVVPLLPPLWAPLLAALVVAVLAWVTKLTRAYGVGKPPTPGAKPWDEG